MKKACVKSEYTDVISASYRNSGIKLGKPCEANRLRSAFASQIIGVGVQATIDADKKRKHQNPSADAFSILFILIGLDGDACKEVVSVWLPSAANAGI